jgi:type VI secretion system secreted protein VgrG
LKARTVVAVLTVGGRPLHVVSCVVREAISAVTSASVVVASTSEVDVGALAGGSCSMDLLVDGDVVRSLTLVVDRAAFQGIEQGSLRYGLELGAPFGALRHTRDVRKFRNMSAKDIVSRVLSEGGVSFAWNIATEPPTRKYCVQYRESKLAFVERLLSFEGIYYVCSDDGSLLLEDTSSAAAAVEGVGSLPLLTHAGALQGAELGVHRFGRGARVRSGKATVNDYNWKTPQVALLKSAAAGKDADLEIYDYPTGYRKPEQGAAIAARRLEALRVGAAYVGGISNVVTFGPGRAFSYAGRAAGRYLLTSVSHEVYDEALLEEQAAPEQTTYRNRFEAIPASVPFRPPLRERPIVGGCHTATVVGPPGEEIHTDAYGRFRARFHWDREATSTDDDSRWLRKLQEPASSMNLARVGWEVSVAYIDGDPDRPIGLAREINGVMPPAYGQPADKTVMTIKTPASPRTGGFNEIRLDDRAGAMRFDVRAERDLQNAVGHDKTERITGGEERVVDLELVHRVEGDQDVEIGGERSIRVDGATAQSVNGNVAELVRGSERIDVSEDLSESVQGSDTESVGSLRLTIAGGVRMPDVAENAAAMAPDPKQEAKDAAIAAAKGGQGGGMAGAQAGATGSLQSMVPSPQGAADQLTGGLSSGNVMALFDGHIGRSAEERIRRNVGAALLSVAGESISTEGQMLLAETVGGAKLTVCKSNLQQSVGGPMALTTGGAVLRYAGKDVGISAEKSKVLVGGIAKLQSDASAEIVSEKITIRGLTSLKLSAGEGCSVAMTPTKVSFEGPMLLEAKESVSMDSPKHNITAAEKES